MRFEARCEERLGRFARVVISPLMEIVPVDVPDPPGPNEIPIFTSENGVAALSAVNPATDLPVWCVGARTASRARASGYRVAGTESNVENLKDRLYALRPERPLVHVAGRHRRGNLVEGLRAAGFAARLVEAYDQIACPLSDEAHDLLDSNETVLAPLFSPRSAGLLAEASADRNALLHAVAISDATRNAWTPRAGERCVTAPTPDAEGMVRAMGRLFDADRSA